MFCPQCGTSLQDNAQFCHRCGFAIQGAPPPGFNPDAPWVTTQTPALADPPPAATELIRPQPMPGSPAAAAAAPASPSQRPLTSAAGRPTSAGQPAAGAKAPGDGDIIGGRYKVLKVLNGRGRARELQCQDIQQGVICVVKWFSPKLLGGPEVLERAKQQLTALKGLQHENIIRVLDVGEENRALFLVMEYFDGTPLSVFIEERRKRGARFAADEVLRYLEPVCAALGAAHPNHLHLNLHAGQILVGNNAEIRVIGIGITQIFGLPPSSEEPLINSFYRAPEMAQGVSRADTRSDIFSLAVLTHELLSISPAADYSSQLAGRIPGVSADVDQVIRIATTPDVKGRFQTASAFLSALKAGFSAPGLSTLETGGPMRPATRPQLVRPLVMVDPDAPEEDERRQSFRMYALMGGGFALFIGIIWLVYMKWFQPDPHPPVATVDIPEIAAATTAAAAVPDPATLAASVQEADRTLAPDRRIEEGRSERFPPLNVRHEDLTPAQLDLLLAEVETFLKEGERFRNADDCTAAIPKYQRVLQARPRDSRALFGLGDCFRQAKDTARAIPMLEMALRDNPRDDEIRFSVAKAYLAAGRNSEAVNEFRKVAKLSPKNVKAWHNLGVAYQKSGDIERAIWAFQKALKTDPKFTASSAALGKAYLKQNKPRDAAKTLAAGLKHNKMHAPSHLALGEAFDAMGKTDYAIKQYERFLKLKPDDPGADRVRNRITELRGGGGQ
ncbi:MAG: Beta-barrel assembly-enhancing protease [Myxococcota bacterium]|nr:Beta-barrel assembly-enhancing protease [Myxococcota bacterium]